MKTSDKPIFYTLAVILAANLNDIYTSYVEDEKIDYQMGRCGEFFGFSKLYDYAVDKEKIDLNIPVEIKQELWRVSNLSAQNQIKRNKIVTGKEVVKRIATKIYKSELIYYYLVKKYNDTNVKMEIRWDDNNEVQKHID